MSDSALLTIDAAINLALGVLLMFFPRGVMAALGVPVPDTAFYPSILGAVLTGIGLALIVERFRKSLGVAGLGLGGAICINLCGAGVLAVWLAGGSLSIPLHGYVFLWGIAIIVLGLSAVELLAQFKRRRGDRGV
jgi:hypothetical protein